jgi:hypothetical protein
MQDAPKFEVHVPGFHSSVDEAKQAQGVPASELPPISEEEREVARRLGMSDEAYSRSKLAGIFGHQRMEARAVDLGEQVDRILAESVVGYRLAGVTWNSDSLSWRIEIETPQGQQNVVLSKDLVNDALDSRTRSELKRLRNMVLFGLGRQELIVKH